MSDASLLVCPQCLSNMVSLSDKRLHCARCKLLWTWESTASDPSRLGDRGEEKS